MASTILHGAASLLVLAATATQAAAGGYATECYQRYRTQPVYDTVYESVQIRPGFTDVQVTPPIYGTRERAVLISPERVAWRVIPAEYGYTKEMVLLEPARTVARRLPPVTETRYRKVLVDDSGYSWEWRWINGRKVLCKIKHKARYQKIAETVVVEPGRVVHETIPARYGYEKRKVLISQARKERYIVPAQYDYVTEQVLLQPKQVRKVHVGPSYQTRARQVLVQEGSEGWQRVAIPRHCKG